MNDLATEIRLPNPVDLHVGARIRLRRRMQGVSQEKLADALGLTFQQVQKYERGANRVSASKLYEIAAALRAPVAYFFDGLADPTGDELDGVRPAAASDEEHGARLPDDRRRAGAGQAVPEHAARPGAPAPARPGALAGRRRRREPDAEAVPELARRGARAVAMVPITQRCAPSAA